jgi:signal peptidase I
MNHRGAPLAARVVVDVAAVVGALCAIAVVVALAVGVRPIVLRSGSMDPAMPVGSLVLTVPVTAEQLEPGDVITVPDPQEDRLVTHRVVHVEQEGGRWLVTLKGDANDTPDAAPYDVTDGARGALTSIAGFGEIIMAMQTPWLVAGALALVVIALLPGRRTEEEDDAAGATDVEDDAPGVEAEVLLIG